MDRVRLRAREQTQTLDERQCATISNAHDRDHCRFDVLEHLGTERTEVRKAHSSSLCSTMETAERRGKCYRSLVHSLSVGEALELCDKTDSRRASCIEQIAILGTPAVCEHVGRGPESSARTHCYLHALATGPIKTCDGIIDPYWARSCSVGRVAHTPAPDLCSGMTDAESADDCWASLAKADGSYCLHIRQEDRQAECLRSSWLSIRDPKACAHLSPPELQTACQARANAHRP